MVEKKIRKNGNISLPETPDDGSFTAFIYRVPRVWLCLALFLCAFIVRLLYLLELSASPVFDILFVDSERYFEWGRALAGKGFSDDRVFYQEPLYPYFLALYFKIFGVGFFGPRLLQIIIGSMTAVLLFLFGEQVFNRRVGLAAGIIAAFYRMFVFYDAMILKTFLSVFLFSASLWSLIWLVGKPERKWRWLFAGILMGLLALVRGNYLPVIAVFFIWLAVKTWPPAGEKKAARLLSTLGISAAGFILVLLPVTIRNAVHGGGFVLTTSQGGQNFYIGNNPENTTGAYQPPRWVRANPMFEEANFREAAKRDIGENPTPAQLSWYWWKKGFRFIADNPGAALKLQMKKIALFWEDYEVPDNQSVYFMKRFSWVLTLLYTPFGLLAALGAAGMVIAWRRRREVSLLYFALAAYFVSIIPFFIVARYRLPVAPVLAVFAAAGIVHVIDLLRKRAIENGWRLNRAAIVVALLVCAFSFFPFYSPLRRRQNEAVRYINLGSHYFRENMIPPAIREYEGADRIYPEGPEAVFRLGLVELQRVDLNRPERASHAIEHFREAVRRGEKLFAIGQASSRVFAPAHFYLAETYHRTGQLLEAEAAYRRAAESPETELREEAAVRLSALQREIANESCFEELRKSFPGDAQANVLLAVSRLRNGKAAEAEKLLTAFLREKPDVPEAWKVLVKVRIALKDYRGARRAVEKLKALGGAPFPEDEILLSVHVER